MLLLDDAQLDKQIVVEESLARALDMYSTHVSPRAIARYITEQVDLPREAWDLEAPAVRFLVALANALTPPDDKRMSFKDRPGQAAREAVPRNYGDALNTIVAMGLGEHPTGLRSAYTQGHGRSREGGARRKGSASCPPASRGVGAERTRLPPVRVGRPSII